MIHHVMAKSSQQTLRTLRPVPPQLKPYIELANVLPAPEQLPGAEPKDRLRVREHWDEDDTDIQNLVSRFPRLREFLEMRGVDVRVEDDVKLALGCRRLKEIRSLLYTIARWPKDQPFELALGIPGEIEKPISVSADDTGKFRLEPHPLLQAISDVESGRIRECPICGHIFWAGRIDQPCCSQKCSGALRSQRWRKAYKGKYKEQRVHKADAEEEARRLSGHAPAKRTSSKE
jgi:hypothetical protein